ncbi:hypothetical protein DM01DRAFT_305321, partial [Hesseltinella vesiculosa]
MNAANQSNTGMEKKKQTQASQHERPERQEELSSKKTAFLNYWDKHFNSIKFNNPDASFAERAALIWEIWNDLPEHERQAYGDGTPQ